MEKDDGMEDGQGHYSLDDEEEIEILEKEDDDEDQLYKTA